MDARLIRHIDDPFDGAMNMAIDQALAESVDQGAAACLRLYRWKSPTLSLGYFQQYDDRQQHPWSADLSVVRRSSGGGAIVHDAELTYSLSIATPKSRHGADLTIYATVHNAIIETIAAIAMQTARRFADSGWLPLAADNAFLCFERRTDEDLVVSGYKIAGSAQRRVGRAILQHGSILLQTSPAAPMLPGLQCVSGKSCDPAQFADHLTATLSKALDADTSPAELSAAETTRAAEIAAARFSSPAWTHRR
ncbi:lipoate--protein ligase family protein [Rosistilla oblonga]|uniref:Octanoyltransferase LipM n=1 Tax=Rosistilla oblonga TaxID=2527990 RepID=A0A518IMF7_9BACT|nr:biotin/lipoate A/B protein ligase family protein [Rosistilla oblonga]QDV54255.1 Octanoyltransferase LipM [Rosistilla oblonga]